MACNQFSQLPTVSHLGNYADSCAESWCRTVKGSGGFGLLLNQLGLGGRAVEVGSYRAQHAGLLLSRWDGIHLSLVDPYEAEQLTSTKYMSTPRLTWPLSIRVVSDTALSGKPLRGPPNCLTISH